MRLPEDTFKANKINLRSSVLLLRKREEPDENLADKYDVTFCDLQSLGYEGSGVPIRGFDFAGLVNDFETGAVTKHGGARAGRDWRAFDVPSQDIFADRTHRFDLKYWEPGTRARVVALLAAKAHTIGGMNIVATERGKSPAADLYVDAADGHALVVKAGTNISKLGMLVVNDDADWIEKAAYDEHVEARERSAARAVKKTPGVKPSCAALQVGDVLLASTGDGTLGKACVFDRRDTPAIADGHVTVIRPDAAVVDPSYLADYLRCGFGQEQIQRLFTGSTGLIELTPEHVRQIVIDLPATLAEQRARSVTLRAEERRCMAAADNAGLALASAREVFRG